LANGSLIGMLVWMSRFTTAKNLGPGPESTE
jgi:hypothetical protein